MKINEGAIIRIKQGSELWEELLEDLSYLSGSVELSRRRYQVISLQHFRNFGLEIEAQWLRTDGKRGRGLEDYITCSENDVIVVKEGPPQSKKMTKSEFDAAVEAIAKEVQTMMLKQEGNLPKV